MKAAPLIPADKILLPIMHIKAGIGGKLLSTFIKRDEINKDTGVIDFLKVKFKDTKFSPLRIQGKQVNELINDEAFSAKLKPAQKYVWRRFAFVVKGFLGKNRNPQYKLHVKNFIAACRKEKIDMTHKMHYLHSHLDKFPENCSDFSDESGERSHQDIKVYLLEIEKTHFFYIFLNFSLMPGDSVERALLIKWATIFGAYYEILLQDESK